MKFKITTKLRKGIKDILGATISLNVNANGWRVNNMKVGQVFYFEAPDVVDTHDPQIIKLCENVLVNTLLYDYEVENVKEK